MPKVILFIDKILFPIFFAVKKNKYHYELSSTKPINERLSPEEFAQRYISELEKKVKTNPEQWFNYFDFYQ